MPDTLPHGRSRTHLKEVLLLFSVPLGIIALLAAFIYIPRFFANPTHDFIYCEGYNCNSRFFVDGQGTLATKDDTNRYLYHDYTLKYYDIERDATRPLQPADAKKYLLDASSKAPDGYVARRNTNSGGFLFWGDYGNNWSLKKGIASKPLTLDAGDIEFIGWVVKDE